MLSLKECLRYALRMSHAAKFKDHVSRLEQELTALSALADQLSPPSDDVLMAARWAIVRTLAEIASFQEKFLLAPAEASGNATLIAEGRAIVDATEKTMAQLIAYSKQWPSERARDDWFGYRAALPGAHRMIRDYFAWAMRIVPSMLESLEGASAAPKRNWTRPIWALRDTIQSK